jgi:hypothetical protein
MIKSTGASWVRFDLSWRLVQRTPDGGYDWSPYDAFIGTMGAKGLVPLPILVDAPEWAMREGGAISPDYYWKFADFAGEAVKRYPGIRIWEIWNEPNHGRFWPGPNPWEYTGLLSAASQMIHSIDPEAS